MPDRLREDELVASWNANAAPWIDVVRRGTIESRRLVTDDAIVEAIAQQSPSRMLDLGCGEGWLTRRFRTSGAVCVGIDASDELVRAAQRADPAGKYETRTYEDLLREPKCFGSDFDLVVANFALLGESTGQLLQSLSTSLLVPGGKLILQTLHPWSCPMPYQDGWRTETFSAFGGLNWSPMPWYFRTLSSWVRLLCSTGYALIELREPLHPKTGTPLSLLLIGVAQGTHPPVA